MLGAQTQAILLPERQLSATLAVNSKLTLLADYQFGFTPTVLPGVGSYFNTSNFSSNGDALGASASCGVDYNPSLPACPVPGYQGSNHVSSFGQYGLGARYQATRTTSAWSLAAAAYCAPAPEVGRKLSIQSKPI